MPSRPKRERIDTDVEASASPTARQSIKRYRVLNFDRSTLEIEGELTTKDGTRILLDGQGKPWLQFTEQEVVTEIGHPNPGSPGIPQITGKMPPNGQNQ